MSALPSFSSSQRKLGSMGASRREVCEFTPIWIDGLNEFDFPGALPSLHGFFSRNSVTDIKEMLDIDKSSDIVAAGKAGNEFVFMLKDATRQIAGNADIKRAIFFAGENINNTTHLELIANFVRPVDPSFRWDDEKSGEKVEQHA
jgi:hypothetical protein